MMFERINVSFQHNLIKEAFWFLSENYVGFVFFVVPAIVATQLTLILIENKGKKFICYRFVLIMGHVNTTIQLVS